MQRPPLVPGDIDAVVFDVIGTLVDDDETWTNVAPRVAAQSGLDATTDLYSRWAGILQEHIDAVVRGDTPWRPHQELVTEAAREAISTAGGDPTLAALELVARLDGAYPAWPDVATATAGLRQDRLVVGVSNGDLSSLARLANANAISWDLAVSVGAAQTFKPAPAAYRYAIDTVGLDADRTLFVAAHPWDLRAASEHGFRTAYVARPGAKEPAAEDRFDLRVEDLHALVEALSGGEMQPEP